MKDDKKIDEIERLLKELKAAEAESAVTVEEVQERPSGVWKVGKIIFSLWRKSFITIIALTILLVVAIPFATIYFLKQGSTFTEDKGTFIEHIQELNELATAEAYTKAVIKRQDNKLFGQSIGLNVPGTNRQLLVVIPGSVKAGVDLSAVTADDLNVNESAKTVKLQLPAATFLGGAEIFFDKVEVYSFEGIFREKANIEEAYELAEEAKNMIVEETKEQGVLQTAQQNAEKALQEMFSFAGYDVTIEFKE